MQGVAEDPKKTKAENLLPTTQKVNEMLNLISEKPNFAELKTRQVCRKKSNIIKSARSAFGIGEGKGTTGSLI